MTNSDGSIAFAISMGFLSLVITLVMIANPVAEEDKIAVSPILNHLMSMFKEFYDGYWYFLIPFAIMIIILPFRYVISDIIYSIRESIRETPQQSFSNVERNQK